MIQDTFDKIREIFATHDERVSELAALRAKHAFGLDPGASLRLLSGALCLLGALRVNPCLRTAQGPRRLPSNGPALY